MSKQNSPKRRTGQIVAAAIFGAIGVACIATETQMVLEKLTAGKGWNSLATAMIVAAVAQAVLAIALEWTLHHGRKFHFAACAACLLIVTVYTFTMSLDRAVGAKASVIQGQTDASKEVTDLEGKLKTAEADATAERKKGGCGKVCLGLEAKVGEIKIELAKAKAKRQEVGANDTVAELFEAIMSPKTYAKVQPALLPSFLTLFGFLAISLASAAAHGGSKVEAPAPAEAIAPRLATSAGKFTDAQIEATILADLKAGALQQQADYAAMFGVSVAKISRVQDRMADAGKIASHRSGKRRILTLL